MYPSYFIIKEDLDMSFSTIADLCVSSGFGNVIKKFHTMVSQENKLRTWAYKNQSTMADFEDNLYEFGPVLVKAFLKKVYYQKCSQSLDPMYCAFR